MTVHPEQTMIFPRYIDKPRMIGMFEIDEFFMAFGTMIFVLFASLAIPNLSSVITMVLGMAISIAAAYGYRKFKKNKPEGFVVHYLYVKGIIHPLDYKTALIKYPYLKKHRPVPYGFTKVLYN